MATFAFSATKNGKNSDENVDPGPVLRRDRRGGAGVRFRAVGHQARGGPRARRQGLQVGTITFTPNDDGATYKLDMDMKPFKKFFLLMRPFKSLDGSDVWCYVPYPYDHPHVVTAQDYSCLKHDLLFFWKTPTSYGAKMDNGLIYDLKPVGDALVGKPQAIGLEKIASPQDNPKMPPYQAADRDDVQDGSRMVESLRVE